MPHDPRFLPSLTAALALLLAAAPGAAEDGRASFPLAAPAPDLSLSTYPTTPPASFRDPDATGAAPARPGARMESQPVPVAPQDNEDEDAPPRRPGGFTPVPNKLPGQHGRSRTIGPRAPDVSVDVSDRTSLGVFGDVSRIERQDMRSQTVKPTRDLGAGVTLQYKFGR